jgi:dihydropteroate synthase
VFFIKKIAYFCSFFAKNWDNRKIFCNFALEMNNSIQLHNRLIDFSCPRVMAILNLSPDSFYTSCDVSYEDRLLSTVEDMVRAGADILDLGACSTRPLSTPVSAQTEWSLLARALPAIRAHWPDLAISVDTFRADVAQQSILHGADMINDVYGGDADSRMWQVIQQYNVPYVLTYARDITNTSHPTAISQLLDFMQDRLYALRQLGIKDVVLDPGFGFGKTVEQNYALLRQLDVLQVLHAPLLVGISRKSMLYKPLGLSPQDVLPATVAAHMLALQNGANILRVHDVEPAIQAIKIYQLTAQKPH